MDKRDTVPECRLCGFHFSSSAINNKQRNVQRKVQQTLTAIYKVVKSLRGESISEHDCICTPCRDRLRNLNKRYTKDNNTLSSADSELIREGPFAFLNTNLKRKGTSVKANRTQSARMKKKSTLGTPARSLRPLSGSVTEDTHAGSTEAGGTAAGESGSEESEFEESESKESKSEETDNGGSDNEDTQSQSNRAGLFLKGGALGVDESFLRSAILSASCSTSSPAPMECGSEDENTDPDAGSQAKRQKMSQGSEQGEISPGDGNNVLHAGPKKKGTGDGSIDIHGEIELTGGNGNEQEITKHVQASETASTKPTNGKNPQKKAVSPIKSHSVRQPAKDAHFLLERLRSMYDTKRLRKESDDEQQQLFFNPMIMKLWRITKLPVSYDANEFVKGKKSISVMADYLHTGKVTLVNVEQFMKGHTERIVNDYVVGLFLIEGLSEATITSIRKLISGNLRKAYPVIALILQMIIDSKSENNRDWILALYRLIKDTGVDWDDKFLLDNDYEDSYSTSQKQDFYFRVYYELSVSNTLSSVLQILLSEMEPTYCKGSDSDEMTLLNYIDSDSGKTEYIYIPSLLLLLLQDNAFSSFEENMEKVEFSVATLSLQRDELKFFIKMLFESRDEKNGSLMKMDSMLVVQLSIAFEIKNVMSILYENSVSNNPYAIRLTMDFYLRTKDPVYLFDIPSKASSFFNLENFSLLEPHHLVCLLKLDELVIEEKKLYDFVIQYTATTMKKRQVLDMLIPYIRFANMSMAEFKASCQDKYLNENEKSIFLLHIAKLDNPRFPGKFFKPDTPRKKV